MNNEVDTYILIERTPKPGNLVVVPPLEDAVVSDLEESYPEFGVKHFSASKDFPHGRSVVKFSIEPYSTAEDAGQRIINRTSAVAKTILAHGRKVIFPADAEAFVAAIK